MVVVAGVTVTGFPDNPQHQEYVAPPPAVKVEEEPAQIGLGMAITVIDGQGFTLTVTLAEPVPPVVVPVTV
jgi:hypothetical protein